MREVSGEEGKRDISGLEGVEGVGRQAGEGEMKGFGHGIDDEFQ